jgi:hypothetical protein
LDSGCILGKVRNTIATGAGFSLLFFFLGCSTSTTPDNTQPSTPAATPTITQVLPQTITAGSQATALKITGTNFTAQSAILWNGAALPTTQVDTSTVTSMVPGSNLASPATVQLQVQNTQTMQSSQTVPFVIAPANTVTQITISTTSLPSGTVSAGYSATLSVTGGTAPYTWSVSTGQLPAGLTLAPATGAISGTPTTSGNYSFGVTVTDSTSTPQSANASITLSIGAATSTPVPLAITSSSLAAGTVGSGYSSALQASGGSAPYTWSITSGSLPAGLSLAASTGLISGTPTASGTSNFTAAVVDSSNPTQNKSASISLTIAPAPVAIITSSLPSGTVGTSYSNSLQAAGGTTPYSWAITNGSLPAGLSIAVNGTISGTPKAAGTSTFTVTLTDAGIPAQTKSASVSLTIAPTTLAISSSTLAAGTVGSNYSATLQATGGASPYTWTVTTGSLPAGLTLAASTGIISGKPTTNGNFSFAITAKDSSTTVQSATATFTLTVAAAGTPLSISSTSVSGGTINATYSSALSASGGTTPYTWSITSGSLPAGLSIASNGAISGTPTTAGTSTFTASVSDSSSPVQSKSVNLSLVVAPAPLSVTTSSLPAGAASTAYSTQLAATGGTPAYTWSIASGSSLPAGLTLAATTGIISGTPTTAGTYSFKATVSDNSSPVQTASVTTSIVVAAASASTGPGTTWYIRPDGGTRYSANQTLGQCDGQGDVAYPGSGVNQHCAFNDFRYMWDDQSYNNDAWVMAGGDTVIIRGCASGPNSTAPDCRIGWDSNTGSGAGYTWCLGGGTSGCGNPPIPPGTAAQHTRILGQNYANCGTATATNKSSLNRIIGGFGIGTPFALQGAQFLDIECLEVTSHATCIWFGSPAVPSSCPGQTPVADFDSDGIRTDVNTHDLLLQDMWIHGHTGRGVKGPIGGTVTCLRCDISTNGAAGWDFDDGNATPMGPNALWNFEYSTIEWSGCNQEYPAVDPIPVATCYSQSTGGYGDGVGTPAGTGLSANIDHSQFIYNTQDGLDLGHVDTGGPYTLNITNSIAYSNSGGTFKIGSNYGSIYMVNNIAIADCDRMAYPITGVPTAYNANLGDFCRANDAVPIDFRQFTTALIANNTVVSYAPTTFDISCWDTSCANSTLNFFNNIVVGYDNPALYNAGGQPGGPGLFYFQETIGNINRSNNIYYGMRPTSFSCPTGYTAEVCVSPGFVNQPTGNGTTFTPTELDNYNVHLGPGSPAVGAGGTYPNPPALDYFGVTRPNPPSIGASEP